MISWLSTFAAYWKRKVTKMKRIALLLFLAFLYGCEKIDQDTPVKDDTAIDAELPDNGEADFKLPEIIISEYPYDKKLYERKAFFLFHGC